MSVNHLITEAARGDYGQKTSDLKLLMRQAEQARSGMYIFGAALAREIGGEFNLAANKGYSRAKQKVANKYDGDASRITDLVRGRVTVDSSELIVRAQEVLNPMKGSRSFLSEWVRICENGNGYRVLDYDDKILDPTPFGWRDISVRTWVPLAKCQGHTGELQIVHRFMAEADKETHTIYEAQRRLLEALQKSGREMTDKEAARFAGMSAQRLEIHNEAAEKAGLTALARSKLIQHPKFDNVA